MQNNYETTSFAKPSEMQNNYETTPSAKTSEMQKNYETTPSVKPSEMQKNSKDDNSKKYDNEYGDENAATQTENSTKSNPIIEI